MSRIVKGTRIYAAYRGERWLCDGTKHEIADTLHAKFSVIDFASSPTAHRRFGDGAVLLYFIGFKNELDREAEKGDA